MIQVKEAEDLEPGTPHLSAPLACPHSYSYCTLQLQLQPALLSLKMSYYNYNYNESHDIAWHDYEGPFAVNHSVERSGA